MIYTLTKETIYRNLIKGGIFIYPITAAAPNGIAVGL